MIGTRLLERYELTEELGRGGMGVVYRAWDPVLNRNVAIKVVSSTTLGRETAERFQREARTVAQMDHPAIVPIHDFGHHEGWLFFVMPWLRGTLLRTLIRERALVLGETLEIGAQIAAALDYSHSRGVIHRDVKPGNIMISQEEGDPRVRVMDFGLARRSVEPRLTVPGVLPGTLSYLSPEQIASAELDGRSDIYSLGAVLYECLTGKPPFSGAVYSTLHQIAHESPPTLRSWGVEVDEELEEIILRCLAKAPSERPQRGGELAAALRRYRRQLREPQRSQPMLAVGSSDLGRPGERPLRHPIVGREAELAELGRRLNAALADECQFVLVGGEVGTGKSRLVLELEQLARARQIQVLRSRFSSRESAFPYQGLCDLVQDYFRARETASSSSVIPDISDLAPDLLALFPMLSEIEEIRGTEDRPCAGRDPATPLGVEARNNPTYVFELLARTLTRLAGGKPLVLLLDNLHEGNLSIKGLEYIFYRLGPTPTLIVGTYLQTEVGKGHPLLRMMESFHGNPRFSSMILGPLEGDDFRKLVELRIGGFELRDDLVQEICEATEGNPLFAHELIRSLLEAGGITRDTSGLWALAEEVGIPTHALPATIQQVVKKRIERLPTRQRKILSVAAVLGKSFEYRDLEALLEDTSGLEDAIDALVHQEILEEDRKSRGDRLNFASGVVRDVLYGELSRRQRRVYHRRHAHQLEKRHAGRLERVYPQLVHHFSEGEVADKTVAYALELARKSLRALSAENAIRTVRTGLELVDDVEITSRPMVLGDLLEILAEAYRTQGDIGRALREAQRAVDAFTEANAPRRAAAAAWLAAEAAWQGCRVEATRQWLSRGIALARNGEAPEALKRLLTLRATVANLQGEHQEAKRCLEEAELLAPSESEQVGEEPMPVGGTLRVALPNLIANLDPGSGEVKTMEEVEVLTNVFETLLAPDPDGHLIPSLCEGWESSADGKHYLLSLRSDVRFSDGAPLTARDVKACLERSARRRTDSPLRIFFSALSGFEEFLADQASEIRGIGIEAERRIAFHLREPLPIFPTLLSDPRAAIARLAPNQGDEGEARLLGTGPFRIVYRDSRALKEGSILLERSPSYWRKSLPSLDRIEFRTSLDASGIAAGLRAGEIDLATDLLPEDLEEILRDPRFRSGLAETTKKNVYFLLFHGSGPVARHPQLRQALTGVVSTQDLAWRTLGRIAQPAVCLIPPSILGHDPGQRHRTLTRAQAIERIQAAGLRPPIRLKAAVHPLLQDQYSTLTTALFEEWSALGIEVSIATPTMETFLARVGDSSGLDLWIGRWGAVYNDPDVFTYHVFHSRDGALRTYYSSPGADRLLERARQESRSAARQAIYRRFEALLGEQCVLLPLFHDVDYRIASPKVCGLRLQSTPPYVNYAQLGKLEEAPSPPRRGLAEGGEIHVPIAVPIARLNPETGRLFEEHEVTGVVFETLTRTDEAMRIIPWLAASFEVESGGRRYRFRLRPKIRFHDGRRLTARDVRYSFEQVIRMAANEFEASFLLPIRGSGALLNGSATELSGFRILSTTEFVVELDRPLVYFPALLSFPGVAIVPEGEEDFAGRWRDGCAGTGPFRVVRFDRGDRLDLERNPHYWRPGYPKCDRLRFHLGISPEKTLDGYRQGSFSLASSLAPADVAELRRDPKLGRGYRESPRLSTCLLALNGKRGPFADSRLRRAFARALDIEALLRETMGQLSVRARGLIPPGFLGDEVARAVPAPERGEEALLQGLRLNTWVHPAFAGQYAPFWEKVCSRLDELGVTVDARGDGVTELIRWTREGSVDLVALRWLAGFPDVDGVVGSLLHSPEGSLAGICGTPELDRLIEAGRSETDPALRLPIYHRIEETIARETLLIPLFHEQTYRFAQPTVKGLRIHLGVPEVRYEELYLAD